MECTKFELNNIYIHMAWNGEFRSGGSRIGRARKLYSYSRRLGAWSYELRKGQASFGEARIIVICYYYAGITIDTFKYYT